MSKTMKYVVSFFIMLVFIFGAVIYSGLFGLPWKKYTVAEELKTYVEERYNIEVEIQERMYNFKDGNYGARFIVKGQGDLTFLAEKASHRDNLYFDYYPEAIWVKEIESEIGPHLYQLFSKEDITVTSVYGIGNELGIKGVVPSYKTIPLEPFFIHISVDGNLNDDDVEKVYQLVTLLQEKKINNIEIAVVFESDEPTNSSKKPTFTSIVITPEEMKNIHNSSDIYEYVQTF